MISEESEDRRNPSGAVAMHPLSIYAFRFSTDVGDKNPVDPSSEDSKSKNAIATVGASHIVEMIYGYIIYF